MQDSTFVWRSATRTTLAETLVPDAIVDTPLEQVFKALKEPDNTGANGLNQASATLLLTALAEYVLEKHSTSSIPEEEEEDDEEQEPEEDGQQDDLEPAEDDDVEDDEY